METTMTGQGKIGFVLLAGGFTSNPSRTLDDDGVDMTNVMRWLLRLVCNHGPFYTVPSGFGDDEFCERCGKLTAKYRYD
jgi:hypothetical protein